MTNTLTAVTYLRVSTDRQARENFSLSDQEDTIKKWAEQNNISIVKIYCDEGKSAFQGRRPAFEELMQDLEHQVVNVDYLLAYNQSRIARNEAVRHNSEAILKKTGTRLIFMMEPTLDDAEQEFVLRSVNGTFNEYYSRTQSKQSAFKMQKVAEENFHTGSIAPYGYKSVPFDDNNSRSRKILVKHEQEGETVSLIFKLAEFGESGIRYGLKKISTHLNKIGYTKRGKIWTINDIHKILTNTIYHGERLFGKKRKRPDLNVGTVSQKVPAYVSKETFNVIRELMKANAPEKNNHQAESRGALLTGIAKCGVCGASLRIATGKSGKHVYYKCRTKVCSSVSRCDSKPIPKATLESMVVEHLKDAVFTPTNAELIVNSIKDDLEVKQKNIRSDALNLEHKKNTTNSKYNRLIELLASGELEPSDKIRVTIKNFDLQVQELGRQLEIINKYRSLPVKNFGQAQTQHFVDAAQCVLLDPNSTGCKVLLRATVSEIIVTTEDIRVSGKKFKLLGVLSNYEHGHQRFLVPMFMSNWRRERDSNPR